MWPETLSRTPWLINRASLPRAVTHHADRRDCAPPVAPPPPLLSQPVAERRILRAVENAAAPAALRRRPIQLPLRWGTGAAAVGRGGGPPHPRPASPAEIGAPCRRPPDASRASPDLAVGHGKARAPGPLPGPSPGLLSSVAVTRRDRSLTVPLANNDLYEFREGTKCLQFCACFTGCL